MTIRLATRADAAALAALGATTFTETFGTLYSATDLAAFIAKQHSVVVHAQVLADPSLRAWLAFADGADPVGYAVAGPCKLPMPGLEPTAGELRQVYVRASHQNLGLGRQLVDVALEWLASCYTPLYIGVWSENVGAQRLYARYGFVKVAEYGFPVGDHVDHEYILRRG